MIAGRGGIHGSAETIAGLLSKGLRYWALADIKLAFPSINTLHLRAICRIDERLTRYIAFHRYALLCEDETEAKAPRARLPQGAAHASFVLSALMDRYLNSVELGDVDVVTYADNIAIGARTMEEATDALFALEKVLSNGLQGLPGGLTLHSHEIRDGFERSDFGAEPALHDKTKLPIRPSVDFVGYRIRWDVSDGKSHFSPSHAGWEKFWRKVSDAWESMPPCVSDETLEKVAYDRFLTWKKAFKLWATQDLAEELFLLNLQVRLNKFSDGKTAVCN